MSYFLSHGGRKLTFGRYHRLQHCPHCGREFIPRALVEGYCPRYWREKKAPSCEEGATVAVSVEQGSLFSSTRCNKRAKSLRGGGQV